MTVDREKIGEAIETLIPQTLDGILTKNRDKARLYVSHDAQLSPLSKIIPPVDVTNDEISDWRFITFDITIPNKEGHVVRLLGNSDFDGGCKITSSVLGIDLVTGIVLTQSGSFYQLVGTQGQGDPHMRQLLHICAYLWKIGWGGHFGVAPVFY